MQKVKVKLLTEHEDGGLAYPAQATIELWPDQAQALIDQGRAESAEIQTATRKPKPHQED